MTREAIHNEIGFSLAVNPLKLLKSCYPRQDTQPTGIWLESRLKNVEYIWFLMNGEQEPQIDYKAFKKNEERLAKQYINEGKEQVVALMKWKVDPTNSEANEYPHFQTELLKTTDKTAISALIIKSINCLNHINQQYITKTVNTGIIKFLNILMKNLHDKAPQVKSHLDITEILVEQLSSTNEDHVYKNEEAFYNDENLQNMITNCTSEETYNSMVQKMSSIFRSENVVEKLVLAYKLAPTIYNIAAAAKAKDTH